MHGSTRICLSLGLFGFHNKIQVYYTRVTEPGRRTGRALIANCVVLRSSIIRMMDGWMDGWINGWMDGWVGGWVGGWI